MQRRRRAGDGPEAAGRGTHSRRVERGRPPVRTRRAASTGKRHAKPLARRGICRPPRWADWATKFQAGQPRQRLRMVLIVTLFFLALVLGKVGLLQSIAGDSLRSAGASQWDRERVMRAPRGTIFDRNGDELALSVPATTVAVNPMQVTDPVGTARTLAEVIGLPPDRQAELEATLAARDRGFAYVARQIDNGIGDQIRALDLAGVSTFREDRRMLPGGVTGRSVIGQTNIDGAGTAGLELQYDDLLTGVNGEMVREVAPGGRSVAGSEEVLQAPVPGGDLILTIDRSLQYAAEQALLRQVSAVGARGGEVIILDTDTGDVMAMTSVRRGDDGVYAITAANYSAVDAFEPGSVGKVITFAAALNEGAIRPDSWFRVPWREFYFDMYLHDSHEHPTEDMTAGQILTESSNIGTIKVSQTIGYETQHAYMQAFGLGEQTALHFPGESSGILKDWTDWHGTEKVTVAYGQGVSSSAIQLAAAVNTVANDGMYVSPRLVLGTVDSRGNETDSAPSVTHEVVSQATAETLQGMLRDVVCGVDGTAAAAQVPGLSVAGKTGTGYKAQENGTYFDEQGNRAYYASFVGFFPAEDPEVTILVSIDEPPSLSDDRFGGRAAAPVFAELAPMIVHEMNVVPPPNSTDCDGGR